MRILPISFLLMLQLAPAAGAEARAEGQQELRLLPAVQPLLPQGQAPLLLRHAAAPAPPAVGAAPQPQLGPGARLVPAHLRARVPARSGASATMNLGLVRYEDEPPPEEVVKAVEKVNSPGKRLTIADVATAGGVDLSTTARGLSQLAAALAGAEGVSVASSNTGELVYSFPPRLREELNARSAAAARRETWNKVKPGLATAGRFAFGISLFVSIAVVFAAITALQASSDSRDSRDSGRDRPMSVGPSFGWYYSPFDFLFPRPYYYSYYLPPPELSLPEAIFSVVFGDGDPNAALDAARLKACAGVIRANNGAVVAEQLAPYLDPPAQLERGDDIVDESWILPAVLALGGKQEVTEDGTIVYLFDDLQVSAVESDAELLLADSALADVRSLPLAELRDLARERNVDVAGAFDEDGVRDALRRWAGALAARTEGRSAPEVLQEREEVFTNAEPGQVLAAGGLATVNFLGVGYLGNLLAQVPAGAVLPGWLGTVAFLYPALVVYATGFVAVPILRFLRLKRRNREVSERNKARLRWRDRLRNKGGRLVARLQAARERRVARRAIARDDVAFDSAEAVTGLDDWDERLSQSESKRL